MDRKELIAAFHTLRINRLRDAVVLDKFVRMTKGDDTDKRFDEIVTHLIEADYCTEECMNSIKKLLDESND